LVTAQTWTWVGEIRVFSATVAQAVFSGRVALLEQTAIIENQNHLWINNNEYSYLFSTLIDYLT